jgi:hypothetical protein
MKPMGSDPETGKSNDASGETMKTARKLSHYVICVNNDGNSASLEVRKVYQCLPPQTGDPKSMIRVIDESGEDYLYPASHFMAVNLSSRIVNALVAA